MLLSFFAIIITKQLTLSVTWPFDSSLTLYYKWPNVIVRLSYTIIRDVILGTCTCTRVVLEYHFEILVLEVQVLVDIHWQVVYFYFLIFKPCFAIESETIQKIVKK